MNHVKTTTQLVWSYAKIPLDILRVLAVQWNNYVLTWLGLLACVVVLILFWINPLSLVLVAGLATVEYNDLIGRTISIIFMGGLIAVLYIYAAEFLFFPAVIGMYQILHEIQTRYMVLLHANKNISSSVAGYATNTQ